nr:MAG TPA: hypothetical protein [Caudoviricetes sp.]
MRGVFCVIQNYRDGALFFAHILPTLSREMGLNHVICRDMR